MMMKGLLKTLKRKAENGKDEPDAKKMKTEIKEVGIMTDIPFLRFFVFKDRAKEQAYFGTFCLFGILEAVTDQKLDKDSFLCEPRNIKIVLKALFFST